MLQPIQFHVKFIILFPSQVCSGSSSPSCPPYLFFSETVLGKGTLFGFNVDQWDQRKVPYKETDMVPLIRRKAHCYFIGGKS